MLGLAGGWSKVGQKVGDIKNDDLYTINGYFIKKTRGYCVIIKKVNDLSLTKSQKERGNCKCIDFALVHYFH